MKFTIPGLNFFFQKTPLCRFLHLDQRRSHFRTISKFKSDEFKVQFNSELTTIVKNAIFEERTLILDPIIKKGGGGNFCEKEYRVE